MPREKKAVIYCRVSTIHQTDKDSTACSNSCVADNSIGGFIFRYVSNMLTLRRAFAPSWTTKQIAAHLLTGDVFGGVKLAPDSLKKVRQILIQHATPVAYKTVPPPTDTPKDSRLQADLDRNIRALERLDELYLYADEALPKIEYLQQRNALQEKIHALQTELDARRTDSVIAPSLFNEQFIAQAAELVFRNTMWLGEDIDFPELAQTVGEPILKDFINAIIETITVDGGHVMAIKFKNGQNHNFIYPQT